MFEHKKIQDLNDYFLQLDKRSQKGVFFYRVYGYNDDVYNFILKYFQVAHKNGVSLRAKFQIPTEEIYRSLPK